MNGRHCTGWHCCSLWGSWVDGLRSGEVENIRAVSVMLSSTNRIANTVNQLILTYVTIQCYTQSHLDIISLLD